MPSLGILTPEEAEALGIPRSVSVISPAYGNRSKASTNSKNPPSSSGSEKLETLQPSEASNSAPQVPMLPAMNDLEDAPQDSGGSIRLLDRKPKICRQTTVGHQPPVAVTSKFLVPGGIEWLVFGDQVDRENFRTRPQPADQAFMGYVSNRLGRDIQGFHHCRRISDPL